MNIYTEIHVLLKTKIWAMYNRKCSGPLDQRGRKLGRVSIREGSKVLLVKKNVRHSAKNQSYIPPLECVIKLFVQKVLQKTSMN